MLRFQNVAALLMERDMFPKVHIAVEPVLQQGIIVAITR